MLKVKNKLREKITKNRSVTTFLKLTLKYKVAMSIAIGLSFIASALAAAPAYLSQILMDEALFQKEFKVLVYVVGALVGSTILKAILDYFAIVESTKVTESIRRDIKTTIYRHLLRCPIDFFKNNKLGDTITRLSSDASKIGTIGTTIFDIFKEAVTSLFLIGRMLYVDWTLALLSLVVLPLTMATISKYVKKLRRSGRKRQDTAGEASSFIQESLSGIFVIKSFSKEEYFMDEYDKWSNKERDTTVKARKVRAKISPINEVVGMSVTGIMTLYGGYLVTIRETMSTGDLISFIVALALLLRLLKNIVKKNNSLQDIMPSADRVLELLDIEPELLYAISDKKPSTKEEEKLLSQDQRYDIKEIHFNDVSFTYPDALKETSPKAAVKNFNLNVKSGETIALVGKSGSGKSTLVNLLPRFYEVTSGNIDVNGIDIRKIPLYNYRNHIGIVPQDTFLFNGTISDNIALGIDDVKFEDIVEAAKKSNAYEFIEHLENGFDTIVGERGAMLSGGQKQRVAIARAILHNPEIMILDEATSALDNESEQLVQEALERLMVGRTTFVIAHRLSTIINADKIVVMSEGEIVEVGSHSELLAKDGAYKRLYNKQFK